MANGIHHPKPSLKQRIRLNSKMCPTCNNDKLLYKDSDYLCEKCGDSFPIPKSSGKWSQ